MILPTELISRMPPPNVPVASHGDWAAAELQLGTRLPGDYKAFVETYGSGLVCGFLLVYSPFALNKSLNLIHKVNQSLRLFKDEVSLFPAPGGLLLCSNSRSGDWIFWRTDGEPDDWELIFNENETSSYMPVAARHYVEFILDFIAGRNKDLSDAKEAFCTPGVEFSSVS